MAARTKLQPLGISWARATVALMALSLAMMLTAVKQFPTNFVTHCSLTSTWSLDLFFSTEAALSLHDRAWITRTFVARLITFMDQAVEKLTAFVGACKFRSVSYLTRHSLLFFPTEAGYWRRNHAWRAASRMAAEVASRMSAPFILLSIAILSTRMRENHGGVRWLIEPSTEALVLWQRVLGIRKVAVWTSPSTEGRKNFRCFPFSLLLTCLIGSFLELFFIVSNPLLDFRLLLFLFVIFRDGILADVELSNPSLDAPQMEWLIALLTVPDGASLIDGVRTDDTLLSSLG